MHSAHKALLCDAVALHQHALQRCPAQSIFSKSIYHLGSYGSQSLNQAAKAGYRQQAGGGEWGGLGGSEGRVYPSREAHLLGLVVALLCPSVADSPCKGHPCGHAKIQKHVICIPLYALSSYLTLLTLPIPLYALSSYAWLLACHSVRVIASDSTHGCIRYTSTSHCMSKTS